MKIFHIAEMLRAAKWRPSQQYSQQYSELFLSVAYRLTDKGVNVQKWTRVFSTRRWVILVVRTRRKKEKIIACPLLDVFDCGQVSNPRLYRLKIMLEKLRPKNKCWKYSWENWALKNYIFYNKFSNLVFS